jgi:hypothetical protein
MRQPPEKSDTGRARSPCVKPSPSSSVAQARVQFADARAVMRGFGIGQGGFDGAQFGIAVERVIERRACQRGRFLRHVRDHPGRRNLQVALVLVQFTSQQREQAGLAAAVGTGQADPPSRVDLQAGVFEQDSCATGKAQLSELDHLTTFTRLQRRYSIGLGRSLPRPDRADVRPGPTA